jgi:hypothetical protein
VHRGDDRHPLHLGASDRLAALVLVGLCMYGGPTKVAMADSSAESVFDRPHRSEDRGEHRRPPSRKLSKMTDEGFDLAERINVSIPQGTDMVLALKALTHVIVVNVVAAAVDDAAAKRMVRAIADDMISNADKLVLARSGELQP